MGTPDECGERAQICSVRSLILWQSLRRVAGCGPDQVTKSITTLGEKRRPRVEVVKNALRDTMIRYLDVSVSHDSANGSRPKVAALRVSKTRRLRSGLSGGLTNESANRPLAE